MVVYFLFYIENLELEVVVNGGWVSLVVYEVRVYFYYFFVWVIYIFNFEGDKFIMKMDFYQVLFGRWDLEVIIGQWE